ncbi:MAG: FAD-monooxygenase [Gammaproteobacteria bacterium]|nr:FAD-monooxygenase [Gammaproteobacteria bacterium]
MANNRDTPVLIAGGGPVGMTLALNLARYGIKSLLVERNTTTTSAPKMDLTNGRSMELFRRLGLIESLRAVGVPEDNCFDIAWITSLAQHELHRFKYPSSRERQGQIRAINDGSFTQEAGMRVSQIVIEPVLKTAIDANPLIDVRFGTSFERIVSQDPSSVVAEIRDVKSDRLQTIRCGYLAGCDGGGSRVRRQLGIDLEGSESVATAYMVHFRSDARDLLQRWGTTWHYQSSFGTMIAQNDHDIWTLQCIRPPGSDLSAIDPRALLEEWAGRKFEYEILQANPWDAHFVVAERFQRGRLILAGDAAHQFVPTGGYGMNSGMADAADLAWKLAALLQGWGGPSLIEAFEAERKPTAWFHLTASSRHVGVRIAIDQAYSEAGDLHGDDSSARARRAALGRKIAELGNIENESWGVEHGYRYDLSPIIASEPNPPPIDPITYRPSTWPGARLPHVYLNDGISIHDKLGLYFTLIMFADLDAHGFEEAAARLRIPLKVLRIAQAGLREIFERDILLVRPDQHIAWRGDTLPSDCARILIQASGNATGAR